MAPDASTPVHTTGELEEQLRRRLRVTSVIWACATGVLATTALVARRENLRADPSTFWTEPPLPGVLFVITLLTIGVVWTLAPGRRLGLARLRAIEWLAFATTASFFVLNPEVPTALSDVIAQCLAKQPGDRFADASSLERALVRSLGSAGWTEGDARAWWQAHVGT